MRAPFGMPLRYWLVYEITRCQVRQIKVVNPQQTQEVEVDLIMRADLCCVRKHLCKVGIAAFAQVDLVLGVPEINNPVRPAAAINHINAQPAKDRIVAALSVEGVRAAETTEMTRAISAVQNVIPPRPSSVSFPASPFRVFASEETVPPKPRSKSEPTPPASRST